MQLQRSTTIYKIQQYIYKIQQYIECSVIQILKEQNEVLLLSIL